MTITAKKGGRSGRDFTPLKFSRVPHPLMKQPCIVPTSHKPHSKGYVYIVPRKNRGDFTAKYQRLHRLAFLRKFGSDAIPSGHELDHICRNPACCNVSHLRVLNRIDHIKVTALLARWERMEVVWPIWEYTGRPGGAALARLTGISSSSAYRYIKEWLAEEEELEAWRAEKPTS